MSIQARPLAELVEINPSLPTSAASDELAAFVPMAALDAETASIRVEEVRAVGEMAAGYSYFQSGDILIAKITPCFQNSKIAQAVVPTNHAFGSTEFHVLRPKASCIHGRYLLHFLRQEWVLREGERKMTGSAGQRRVPKHFLESLLLPTPPIEEQRRIAVILDQAEALRAKRRTALAKLDSLAQSIFIEMFGDPAINPNSWKTYPIGDLGDIHTGKTPPSSLDGMFGGPVPFATPGDLDSKLTHFQRSLTPAGAEYSKVVRPGSALVGCIGNIGKMAKTPVRCSFNQQINAIEWGANVDDDFGIASLSFVVPQMLALSSSTTVPILNKSSFSTILIPVPPLTEQKQFAQRIHKIEQTCSRHGKSLDLLNGLFAVLQHRAFRGEL